MPDTERMQLEFLLKHLFKSRDFMEESVEHVNRLRLFEPYADLQHLWGILHAQFTVAGIMPTPDSLDLDLQVMRTGDITEELYLPACERALGWLRSQDDVLGSVKMAEGMLQTRVEADVRRVLASSVEEGLDNAELIEKMEWAKNTMLTGVSSKPVFKSLFGEEPSLVMEQVKREPTGVDFLDGALGGGVLPGEVIGFVMPAKTGKTTLAWQLAKEAVMRREHTLLFSFEQALDGDLTLRAYVLATDSNRDSWKNPSQELLTKYQRVRPLWQEYLHPCDTWVDPTTPLKSIKQIYDSITDTKLPIKNVILDWWGRMLGKLNKANPARNETEMRANSADWMADIKGFSQKHGVKTFMFHQLAGAEASKSASRVSNSHKAQGDSNFNNMLDFCFVSSRRDREGNVTFVLDAARASDQAELRTRIDGPGCRFLKGSSDSGGTLMSELTTRSEGFGMPTMGSFAESFEQ